MTTLVYSLPSSRLTAQAGLVRDLKAKTKVILEQLPKPARQKIVRHLTLGHLVSQEIRDLGLTVVGNKQRHAILNAVGLEPKYPDIEEILDCFRYEIEVRLVDDKG